MRVKKFRAWDRHNKRMSWSFGLGVTKLTFDTKPGYCEEVKINDLSIEELQFIGLKDKNGKEIYEGDIVRIVGEQELDYGYSFDWKHNAVVKWDEDECSYYLDVIKKYEASICEDGYFTVDTFTLRKWHEEEWWIEYEIIGNIYENPELLGGELIEED